LRHLVKTIMKSRTYQLSAAPNATNRDDEANGSHALIRPLQAEQLLDPLAQVLETPQKFNGVPEGTRAGQLPGGAAPTRRKAQDDMEKFMAVFGKPVRSLSCECERSEDTTLNQAFQLITGPMLNGMLTTKDNRIGRLLDAKKPTGEIIEELYLAAL